MEADHASGQADACEAPAEETTTEPTLPPSESDGKPAQDAQPVRQRALRELKPGPFKYWHYLAWEAGKNDSEVERGERRTQREIRVDRESLGRWRDTLIAGGWLKIIGEGPYGRNKYLVCDGRGQQYKVKRTENPPNEMDGNPASTGGNSVRNGGKSRPRSQRPRRSEVGKEEIKDWGRLTIMDLKDIIGVTEERAKKLKDIHAFEDALTIAWDDKDRQQEYRDLRSKVKALKAEMESRA